VKKPIRVCPRFVPSGARRHQQSEHHQGQDGLAVPRLFSQVERLLSGGRPDSGGNVTVSSQLPTTAFFGGGSAAPALDPTTMKSAVSVATIRDTGEILWAVIGVLLSINGLLARVTGIRLTRSFSHTHVLRGRA
jgi:hypothetical protein